MMFFRPNFASDDIVFQYLFYCMCATFYFLFHHLEASSILIMYEHNLYCIEGIVM
jgi:hypothetical protein